MAQLFNIAHVQKSKRVSSGHSGGSHAPADLSPNELMALLAYLESFK
jgi:hypothetical protein